MKYADVLLSKRWIIKSEDRQLYYQIKDNAKALRALFLDKAGLSLMIHPLFIRLDKVPGKSEPWMGITQFKSTKEYQLFCFLLVYLEDKEINDPFILSDVCEFIASEFKAGYELWTNFQMRKMLVNVLKFAIDEKLILVFDGVSEDFVQNINAEVLFRNSGLSRYFMRNFNTDILNWKSSQDISFNEWHELADVDRGALRKYRIYRRLLLSPGIYEDPSLDDFGYLRNYKKRIENDLNQFFSCDLHLYQNMCFPILEDDVKVGEIFPKQNALDELVMCCCSDIRKYISKHRDLLDSREILEERKEVFMNRLRRSISAVLPNLPSTYCLKNLSNLVDEVMIRLSMIGFIKEQDDIIQIYPLIGMMAGSFRKDVEE